MKTPSPRAFLPKIDVKNPHSIGGSEMRRFYVAMCGGKWTLTADWLPDWAEWPPGADKVPDWAFKALGEFCRCCYKGLRNKSLGYLGLRSDSPKLATLCSKMEVLRTNSANQILLTFKSRKAFNSFFPLACGQMVPLDLPVPDTDREFSIPPTAQAYLTIFLAWPEVFKLKNAKEANAWLFRMKAFDKEDGYPRNTYNLLKRIGFPLTDEGGAPRKKNPPPTQLKRPS